MIKPKYFSTSSRFLCLAASIKGIPDFMNLDEAQIKQSYRILRIHLGPAHENQELMQTRFQQLGFIPGVELKCLAIAPILKSPLLVEIRGIQVALDRHEAQCIEVEPLV
jgi:Fe2+ transport system protein FeoA